MHVVVMVTLAWAWDELGKWSARILADIQGFWWLNHPSPNETRQSTGIMLFHFSERTETILKPFLWNHQINIGRLWCHMVPGFEMSLAPGDCRTEGLMPIKAEGSTRVFHQTHRNEAIHGLWCGRKNTNVGQHTTWATKEAFTADADHFKNQCMCSCIEKCITYHEHLSLNSNISFIINKHILNSCK